jgi:hypothetical protein
MSQSAALNRARAARGKIQNIAPMPVAAMEAMSRATGDLSARMRRSELTPRLNPTKPLKAEKLAQQHGMVVARLAEFGLAERPTIQDNNTQFRAIADQLYGSEEEHPAVRKMAIEQLVIAPDLYVEFVAKSDESYDDYVERMSLPDTPGDTVTLQAIADYLCLSINLVTPTDEGLVLVVPAEMLPADDDYSNSPVWLAHWGDTMYKSIGSMQVV